MKIPHITTEEWNGLTAIQARKKILAYYKKHYLGKSGVINEDLGIKIEFLRAGGNKISFGGKIYIKKAAVIKVLKDVIKIAVYNNFGNRKTSDNPQVIGYLNFKSKIIIDGKVEHLRLSVQLRNNGKFYYNHEVNIY